VAVVSPLSPEHAEVEALIREARVRQRMRRLRATALVAALAGAVVAIHAIATARSPTAKGAGGTPVAVTSGRACGVRVAWTKILDRSDRVLYREPVSRTFGHQMQCAGASIWVVFYNGVASSQEAYFGVHSADGGRTWRPVFTEGYFGLHAPHDLDAYLGPWTLTGSAAYFVGYCPACGRQPTESLWVTENGGRTFRRYDLAALSGYWPKRVRVSGVDAIVFADRNGRKKTATVRLD
jgi:hypothetical protein